MRTVSRLCIFAGFVLTTMPSLADWTTDQKISSIKVVESGDAYVRLVGFNNKSDSIACGSDTFVLRRSRVGFEAQLSVILAAHMAGQVLRFSYYGCDEKFIKLGSVQLS